MLLKIKLVLLIILIIPVTVKAPLFYAKIIIDCEMASFDPVYSKTMKFEGGYQAYSSDPANYNSLNQLVGTKYGVSGHSYEGYIGHPPTVDDIKAITPEIAKDFYEKKFWNMIRGSEIKSQDIADIIFGLYIGKPSKSNLVVKQSLNDLGHDISKISNPYSDEVVKAINNSNQKKLFDTLKSRSLEYVGSISHEFRQGWINKMSSYEYSGSKKKWILISIITIALLAGGYYAYRKGWHRKYLKMLE